MSHIHLAISQASKILYYKADLYFYSTEDQKITMKYVDEAINKQMP